MRRLHALTFGLTLMLVGTSLAAPARPLYLPSAVPTPQRYASVAGTSWHGTLFSSDCRITFNADSTLTYKDAGNPARGSWRQEGNRVFFDINQYSHYEVIVSGDRLSGSGRNKTGLTCSPSMQRVASEKL